VKQARTYPMRRRRPFESLASKKRGVGYCFTEEIVRDRTARSSVIYSNVGLFVPVNVWDGVLNSYGVLEDEVKQILTEASIALAKEVKEAPSDETKDLRGAWLYVETEGVDLKEANLRGWHLEGAFLMKANLEKANLTEAHLEGAFVRMAYLKKAELYMAHLEKADLRMAHLERVNSREAHLENADLSEANLEMADFM
jgi:hypothetical protein